MPWDALDRSGSERGPIFFLEERKQEGQLPRGARLQSRSRSTDRRRTSIDVACGSEAHEIGLVLEASNERFPEKRTPGHAPKGLAQTEMCSSIVADVLASASSP